MEERNLRKTMIGTVVSNKMDKTVVVAVKTNVKHDVYSKIVKRTYKLKAHDENNECQVGDKVKVNVPWEFGFRMIEKEGTIKEIYSNGLCKVEIPLKYGGYRVVRGSLKDCIKM